MNPFCIPPEMITTPPEDHLKKAIYVKHFNIIGSRVRPQMTYNKVGGGNLFLEYLMRMSVQGPQGVDKLMTVGFRPERGTDKDCSESILKRGILFSGEIYRFLGHSNSQLKERTCFLMNESDERIYELLAQFGEFSQIKTTAKRAKRIGLLFSSFDQSINLQENQFGVIDDIKVRKYTFTDGCGFMSDSFAQEIQDVDRGLESKPSVVQVRYQGYKGVLILNPHLEDGVKVQFRNSMKKFSIPDERLRTSCTTFGVVKCSRPYTIGYLNKQITMLLADSGVKHSYLRQLQNNFHYMLRELCSDRQSAESYLCIKGERKLLGWLHDFGLGSPRLQRQLKALRAKEVRKMQKEKADEDESSLTQTLKCKLRVLVPKSRVVFGACDPFQTLEYGQCVFQPTLFDEEQMEEFQGAEEVIVVRNPCYHPGDIRTLKLIKNKPEYAYLSDCIVFPTKGSRPHADESAGGDLDGDEFFVSWDKNLIPSWRSAPFDYSSNSPLVMISNAFSQLGQWTSSLQQRVSCWGYSKMPSVFGTAEEAEKKKKLKERTHMLEYFSTYNNDLVARVDAIFMKYAALYGPSCQECVNLNR
ncbi:probable RNA-dependent RNA polymerase 1 [Stylophora pistillata]|nr:probable RNA-dependent RNA polymerase 1 [Stylophora pistillata]